MPSGIRFTDPSAHPTSTLLRSSFGIYELSLEGRFRHPHWVAALFSGLARHHVSVVSGRASSPTWGRWKAAFRLDFSQASIAAESIDYVALAETEPRHSREAPPMIGAFAVRRRPDQQLELDVRGPDQIGFLGGLLGELSMLMLFPSELFVDTVDGRIRDTIVLRGMGGSAPPDAARGSLETLMVGLSHAA